MTTARCPLGVLLATALMLPACDALATAAPPTGPLADLGEKAAEWQDLDRAERAAYDAGDWAAAAARQEEKITLYPSAEPGSPLPKRLEGLLVRDLYDLACCRALSGDRPGAFDALERAFRDGTGEIGFDHLAQDPDLESLHGEPRWRELTGRLAGRGGGVSSFSWSVDNPGAPRDWIIELRPGETDIHGTGLPEFPAQDWSFPGPPYRVSREVSSWTSRLDAGEMAARCVAPESGTGEAASKKEAPAGHRVLKASGPEMVRLAWEVLLRRPEAFTHAVLDGPAPPARVLLDRGAEKVKAVILVADAKGVPDARVPVKVEVAGSAEEALRRALR